MHRDVIGIGWLAAEILGDGGAEVQVVAPLTASIYIAVRGEILWLGGPSDLMHRRAILLSAPPTTADLPLSWSVTAWRPDRPIGEARALREGARRLSRMAASLGAPEGFGAWLTNVPLSFPLTGAGKAADALATACARDDAGAAAEAARPLLGLGAGLTPSGDDFVGGAFFARAALTALAASDPVAWTQAAMTVRAAARDATTPISATLLGDLVDGHGWSALHELLCSLTNGDFARAVDSATRLTRLGHSSGWDVLAGFIAGLAG